MDWQLICQWLLLFGFCINAAMAVHHNYVPYKPKATGDDTGIGLVVALLLLAGIAAINYGAGAWSRLF